ncbi:MucR family transcriptional regulator [Rhizobium sp. MHM7A]|uniref:MucR family transcriptional regulator n=1 Tax=Rhizobium sp. MHM7A TaxID=2583233 RepID=UPI001106EA4E|nr:MucR family transcriptional regulator [Rhizobium sp. MHM7A]TLX16884.1 hypothetical protein FFR93_05930 [Rhizobium sp. MHM7A]
MANTPSGTVLAYTVDIVKDLLASGNKVDANALGDLITNFGDRLLELKNKEEGVVPADTPTAKATPAPAPTAAPVEETKPAEAPAAASTTEAPQLRTAEPEKRRGRKKGAQATAKRKPGRPKGSGRKAAEPQETETEAVSEVTTTETPEVVAAEEPITEFNNPDPKAPDYKFKHLLDRFGTNPDGTAKRFNNMTEEETFDGEVVRSLFDGTTRKMLKRHLGTDYGMTVPEYIRHFGLSKGYRPVGKDFSASKSVDAKKTKLGHKAEEVEQEAAPEQPIATPVKAVRRTRARATQEA